MAAKTNYDEQAELTKYVCRNFRHLMTNDENLAYHALTVESKMGKGSLFGTEPHPKLERERKRYESNAFVQRALPLGFGGLDELVRERITKEMPPTFIVKRCHQCQRILATPKAEQCLWCGADWHDTALAVSDIDQVLRTLDEKYPLIPHTNTGRLFSTVRRMKAEKEAAIPIDRRIIWVISENDSRPPNKLDETSWESFFQRLSRQLREQHPELYAQIFDKP